nr:hypothetical protein [Tanacetum cinerariifolium]
MDQQKPTLAKIPILDTGKFKQWQFSIQQYLQHEHYALWEVSKFKDSYKAPANVATTGSASDGTGKKKGRTVTLTTDDMQKRKNDVKERTTLLLSLPDEHKLRFTLAQVEARLAEHRNQELKYYEKIRVLEFKTESSTNCIENLKKELKLIKKEKEGLDSKLAGSQTALKDLDSLLESQRLDKNKEGLGYSAVPPPPAQVYFPPKKDLSWTGILEFKDDIVTNYSRPSPAIESTSDDAQNRNPSEASPSTISP